MIRPNIAMLLNAASKVVPDTLSQYLKHIIQTKMITKKAERLSHVDRTMFFQYRADIVCLVVDHTIGTNRLEILEFFRSAGGCDYLEMWASQLSKLNGDAKKRHRGQSKMGVMSQHITYLPTGPPALLIKNVLL